MKTAPLRHEAVIAALKGQALRIPDLRGLFSSWPTPGPSPHHLSTCTLVTKTIQRLAETEPLVGKRVNDDIGMLTCLWYPKSPRDRLGALAQFSTWLVCWDDCVDAKEGDLAGNFKQAEAWRSSTLSVAETALRLAAGQEQVAEVNADNTTLHGLLSASLAIISRDMTETQRQAVFRELRQFVTCCGTEQRMQMDQVLAEYDTYMECRLGTVGGGLLCSLVEYALGHDNSAPAFRNKEADETLRRQVCVLLALVNDLLSLKKELRTSCVMNAVASLMTPEASLSGTVDLVIQKIVQAREAFDHAAAKATIQEMLGVTEERRNEAESYIDGCRTLVTGTLEFTLSSPRYGLAKFLRSDGSLQIAL